MSGSKVKINEQVVAAKIELGGAKTGKFGSCYNPIATNRTSNNSTANCSSKRNAGIPIKVEFNGLLRPEQALAAAELLKYENGILSATTAFGKTVVASYMISQKKVNTLILVHTSALLDQWKKSLS